MAGRSRRPGGKPPSGDPAQDADVEEPGSPPDAPARVTSSAAVPPVTTPFSVADDEWESELAAWDAAIPIATKSPAVSGQSPVPSVDQEPGQGALPSAENSAFETPTTVVSQEQQLKLEDLPEVMSAGVFEEGSALASRSYAALVATDQSAPGLFESDPPPEEPPAFPTEISREMSAAPWRDDVGALISLGSVGAPTRPAGRYWETLRQVVADERSFAGGDQERMAALGLAGSRLADLLGDEAGALEQVEAVLALDPSLPSTVVAHRARLILVERGGVGVGVGVGGVDDERAAASLRRLASLSHPDQSYYRLLQAERVLTGVSHGIVDSAAAETMAAQPEGLARVLAEAELVWRQPTAAAALLETAAHRVGGALEAALLYWAAGLNELANEFHAAAEQRSVAAGLEAGLEARLNDRSVATSLGVLRDVARLDAAAAVPMLEDLVPRFPPSPLKVALARWGAAAARRSGDRGRAWRFVARPDALGPVTAGLVRDRLDLWPEAHSSGLIDSAPADSIAEPISAVFGFWDGVVPRTCLSLRAFELARDERSAGFAMEWAEGVGRDPSGEGALGAVAIAAPLQELAGRTLDLSKRLRALRLWRNVDPVRWTSASFELAAALAPAREVSPTDADEESTESVLEEIATRDATSPVFWALAALAARRGQFAEAAAHIDRGLARTAWSNSPLAAPLAELAAEYTARFDLPGAAARLGGPARARQGVLRLPRGTLRRVLRQLGDRDLWAQYVEGEMAAIAHEDHPPDERNRRAALLLEPVFWSAEAGEGDDVPSLVSAALDVAPLHPTAFGLALAGEPEPGMLVDRLLAGRGGPGGDRWVLAAAVAAAVTGDARRGLALAVASGGRAWQATVRRLAWAAPDTAERARLLRELAAPGASADILVEAAEAAEETGAASPRAASAAGVRDLHEARRLFEAAATAPGCDVLAADIRGGLDRLAVLQLGPLGPALHVPGGAAGRARDDDRERFRLLVEAVRADRWDDVVTSLVGTPAGGQPPSVAILALGAALDEARAGGLRAAELWSRARAAASRPKQAGPSEPLPGETTAMLRAGDGAEIDPDEAAAALERLAAAATRAADERSAALLLVVAAQRASGLDGVEARFAVERCLRAAVAHDPTSVPAALAWRRWLSSAGQAEEAARASAAEAEALTAPALRIQALLRAAALLVPPVDADGPRTRADSSPPLTADAEGRNLAPRRVGEAAAFLLRALEIVPQDHAAFTRLRDLYEETGRHAELAQLLAMRLNVTSNPFEVTALRLARAEMFADPLNDRPAAKAELEAILQKEPQHTRALERLADLEQEDGHHAAAADLLIRRAFIERSPDKLRDLFLRLGRIYTQRLPDAKRAVGAYARVLQLEANNREALDELSRLYLGLGETKSAISITERLVRIEAVPEQRSSYHVRLAHLAERAGDPRAASFHFRRAAEESPRDIDALGELVRYLEKSRDTAGKRAYLDRVAGYLRKEAFADPSDRSALDALVAVLRLRGRSAAAAATAELSAMVEQWEREATSDPTSGAASSSSGGPPPWAAASAAGRRLAALAKPAVDEQTFGAEVPPSVRHLFRILGPILWDAGKADVSRHGVGRADRVAAGRSPRDIFEVVAADLAAGPFDVYVKSAGDPRAPALLAVEPGRPPAIIVSASLLALGAPVVWFAAGRALRLVSTHLDVALTGGPPDLGAWLGGVVRQFVPDYRHPDVSAAVMAERAAKVAKLMPRRLRQEIMPFAMESSGPLDLTVLRAGIRDGANRVGLLASGSLAAALRAVLALSDEAAEVAREAAREAGVPSMARVASTHTLPSWSIFSRNTEAHALVAFALSDDYDDLVKALE